MGEIIPAEEQLNYETFRDCLSEPVIKALVTPVETFKRKKRRHTKKDSRGRLDGLAETMKEATSDTGIDARGDSGTAAEDLGEFVEYLSSIIFPSLPPELRLLSHSEFKDSPSLQETYSTPLSAKTYTSLLNLISPSAIDSLESYGLLPQDSDSTDQHHLFTPVFNSYISAATAPPPIWSTTRTAACELCERDWVPLTYHHLIPRSTHARVLKRGWHLEDRLNSVAWLCRACHNFVHRLAGNEQLAKGFYTVELIRNGGAEADPEKRAEVEGWVKWVGGVRWKSR